MRARLYDADGHDREVDIEPGMAGRIAKRQLLWIDVDRLTGSDLDAVAAAVGLEPSLTARLATATERADLTQFPTHVHLVLQSMEAPEEGADDRAPVRQSVNIVAGRDWVVTVHNGPLQALRRIDDATEGETRLGALDASGFVAAVADEVLAGYFNLVERIEREIDELDERALRGRRDDAVLVRIVGLRRRIGAIRRTLAPHRVAFAALGRPEMELHEEFGRPWPGLTDRLERALDAVENLRELLLGTFDIHMGRAAQDANEVMKVLTLLSAVLLPAVVLGGVMGMNFPMPFFDDPNNYWFVVTGMILLSVGIIVAARLRRWI